MKTLTIKGYEVLVDDEDVDKILQHTWYVNSTSVKERGMHYFYTVTHSRGKKQFIYLHRFLLGCTVNDGFDVDHIDHNGLNLCKQNLRKCAHKDNIKHQNKHIGSTSGYKGVHWSKCAERWQARITSDNVEYYLGLYDSKEAAARVYDKACIHFHKDFSILNFPREDYGENVSEEVMSILKKDLHSEYMGVSKSKGFWSAYISKDKRRYHLGLYETEENAARAYDIALDTLCKGKRQKNFPDAVYTDTEIKVVQEHIDGVYPHERKRKSEYLGIYQQKNGKWTAYVVLEDRKQVNAGTFLTEKEAAIARDAKAFELLGQKAKLNFPERVVDGVYNKEVL